LQRNPKHTPAVLSRPQSTLRDFYRELGDIFGVELKTSNRFGSFKTVRETWLNVIKSTCQRAVLLVDEAQSVREDVLSELRLLGSAELDSRCLVAVIIAGDERLHAKLQQPELLPLASRIRECLILRPYEPSELEDMLVHVLEQAACPQMMTPGVRSLLADHAGGNPRVLMNRAEQMLSLAMKEEVNLLDEKLYHELFTNSQSKRSGR
jgi:type II secretory pathway predicted ATPase ExeA